MNPIPCTAGALAAALSLALSLPHAALAGQEPATMHDEDHAAHATVEGEGASLEAAFAREGERLGVRYRIRNTGDGPLAVFDRGDRHAVLSGRVAAGAVPSPHFSEDGAGGLTLAHVARALPHPAPTLPPVPLAARLAPGDRLEGEFGFDLSLATGLERVRWCLGVAPFDEATFEASESSGPVAVWTAPFELADTQQRLCTPWFDVKTGAFAEG